MNASTKDLLNVMSKFMAMGFTLEQVLADTSAHPANKIHRPELGNLSPGAPADVALLNEEHGRFRLLDMDNTRLMGTARLQAELAIRAGKVVYDLNGFSMDAWDDPHTSSNPQMASHWTGFRPRPRPPLPEQVHPRMSKSKEASGCFSTAPAAKPLYWV